MPSSISISLDDIVSGINIEEKAFEDDREIEYKRNLTEGILPVEDDASPTRKVFNFTSDIHVLVIDDSAISSTRAGMYWRVCGYRVTCCSGAADAFKLLRKDCLAYDCVMCDKNMPNMTGVEFVKQIKDSQNLRHIPSNLVSVVLRRTARYKYGN